MTTAELHEIGDVEKISLSNVSNLIVVFIN